MYGPQSSFVMYDEELKQINEISEKLLRESNAKVIFLVDKNGQLMRNRASRYHQSGFADGW